MRRHQSKQRLLPSGTVTTPPSQPEPTAEEHAKQITMEEGNLWSDAEGRLVPHTIWVTRLRAYIARKVAEATESLERQLQDYHDEYDRKTR